MKVFKDFQGRKLRLTAERLQHILEHPEMVNMQDCDTRNDRNAFSSYSVFE